MNQFNCVILVSNFGEKKYFLISFPEFPQKKNFAFKNDIMVLWSCEFAALIGGPKGANERFWNNAND